MAIKVPHLEVTAVDSRRHERRPCRLAAKLQINEGEIRCQVVNLSLGGVSVQVDPTIVLRPGLHVVVSCRELGPHGARVSWGSHPRYGLAFDHVGTSPLVQAYFDSLQ